MFILCAFSIKKLCVFFFFVSHCWNCGNAFEFLFMMHAVRFIGQWCGFVYTHGLINCNAYALSMQSLWCVMKCVHHRNVCGRQFVAYYSKLFIHTRLIYLSLSLSLSVFFFGWSVWKLRSMMLLLLLLLSDGTAKFGWLSGQSGPVSWSWVGQ